jgi:hypothetical protein
MTEGRNSQMTRGAGPDQDGWGATTNNSGTGTGGTATAGGIGAKLTGAATSAKSAMRSAADEAEANARPVRAKKASRQPRRARLTLSHLNVYSVFKFSCVLAIALFLVWLIVVGVLYGILDVAGALSKVNSTVQEIDGQNTKPVISGSVVFGVSILIGVVNMVLFIIGATIGSMIYNVCADLVGGVEVTLSERD